MKLKVKKGRNIKFLLYTKLKWLNEYLLRGNIYYLNFKGQDLIKLWPILLNFIKKAFLKPKPESYGKLLFFLIFSETQVFKIKTS